VTAFPGPRAFGGGPLAGSRIVRLIYLDEAGIHFNEDKDPILCVAGVIIDADNQWKDVEAALNRVAFDWLPPPDNMGFIFHTTDLYHGSGYWDREVWPEEIRFEIIWELLAILEKFRLPVVVGFYEKKKFGKGSLPQEDMKYPGKQVTMQGMATMNCLISADQWIAKYTRQEVAIVILENTDRVKVHIKLVTRIFKSEQLLAAAQITNRQGLLPLKHIIDTPHFAAKSESPLLQLADLCAFILRRGLAGKSMPERFFQLVMSIVMATRGIDLKEWLEKNKPPQTAKEPS
jgi:hypothetical protein